MRAKLNVELDKEELDELQSMLEKFTKMDDEVTVRLSTDKRKVARLILGMIEEQKSFWEDERW